MSKTPASPVRDGPGFHPRKIVQGNPTPSTRDGKRRPQASPRLSPKSPSTTSDQDSGQSKLPPPSFLPRHHAQTHPKGQRRIGCRSNRKAVSVATPSTDWAHRTGHHLSTCATLPRVGADVSRHRQPDKCGHQSPLSLGTSARQHAASKNLAPPLYRPNQADPGMRSRGHSSDPPSSQGKVHLAVTEPSNLGAPP